MLSVGRILDGAFGVFRNHPAAVAIWAGIYLAINVVSMLATRSMMATAMDPTASDPSTVMAAMVPVWLVGIALGLIGIVLYTAVLRAVLRPGEGGPAFLRLGMDELRTLGLAVIFAIVGIAIGFVASLAVGAFGAGAALTTQSGVATVGITLLVALAVFAVIVFLLVRFSLAFPLTLWRRRIVIGEAWTLSRGHFWKLFGAALVVTLIGFVLSMVVGIAASGGYIADLMSAAGNPEATALAVEQQTQAMSGFSVMMVIQALGNAVLAAVWLTLSGGSIATAARLLLTDEVEDAEDVFG